MGMRKLAALLLCTGLSAPALAGDGRASLLVFLQQQDLAADIAGSGIYAPLSGDPGLDTDAGLGLGFAFGPADGASRVLVEFGGVAFDTAGGDGDVLLYTLGWERFFPLAANDRLRPFAGLQAGIGMLDVGPGLAPGLLAGDDERFTAGLSGGLQYALGPQLLLELRARWLSAGLDARLGSVAGPGHAVQFRVDAATSASAGIAFRF